jgi:AraC-like DNA-binding protein
MKAWQDLMKVVDRLRFEPHDIAAQLDRRRHYTMELSEEFPLSIKLFRYTSRRHTRGTTWHERLELFLPIDGKVRFRMGEQELDLQRGDLLVVDNLKLHHVVDFPGFDARVVVISFLPEFVYSLGSPSHDYAFLLPFYSKTEHQPHVLRIDDSNAPGAHGALAGLLDCFFAGTKKPFFQAGAKAFLLQLLFHLATQFRGSEVLHWEFMRQQERSVRLRKVFQQISAQPADKLPIRTAAKLAGMSATQFMKTFKQVAGMTLVAYLNHVRLAKAARLLRDTGRSIADISSETGFSDQSYFDKRFKRAFGRTPKQFRADVGG